MPERRGGRVRGTRQYVVWVDVPRASGWRAWNAAAGGVEDRLGGQGGPAVLEAQTASAARAGSGHAGTQAASTVRSTVVPTIPFFFVIPNLVRSSRAMARNRATPSPAAASVIRISTGAVTPCAVTSPARSQPAPSGRGPRPLNTISG